MTTWDNVLDFGVVHPLIYFECRAGAGPILETLPTIINDSDFGAIEIAPIKDPAVRKQARELLASSGLQVVYLPILPIIIEEIGLGSADSGQRSAAQTRLPGDLDGVGEPTDHPRLVNEGFTSHGHDGSDATPLLRPHLGVCGGGQPGVDLVCYCLIVFVYFHRPIMPSLVGTDQVFGPSYCRTSQEV